MIWAGAAGHGRWRSAMAQRQGRQRDRASDLAQIMRFISEFLCYLPTDCDASLRCGCADWCEGTSILTAYMYVGRRW